MQPDKPRIWLAIAAGVLVVPVTISLSILVVVALEAMREAGIDIGPEGLRDPDGIGPDTFLFFGILAQIVVFTGMYLLAKRSRQPAGERFALARGRLSLLMVPVLFAGTLVSSWLGAVLSYGLFNSVSERADSLNEMIRSESAVAFLPFLITIAVLPGLSEELLFRGYIQSRLLRRLPAWFAILTASFLFACAHGEVQYAIGIFPLGVWLGLVAYYAESIWPSVICHFANNALVLVVQRSMDPSDSPSSEQAAKSLESIELPEMLGFSLILLTILTLLAKFVKSRRKYVPFVTALDPTPPIAAGGYRNPDA